MKHHRRESARTRAIRARAARNEALVREALASGATLRLSNRTDIAAGIVHKAAAGLMVRRRQAAFDAAGNLTRKDVAA